MKDMLIQVEAARKASVPLIAIQTPDPATTIDEIKKLEGAQVPIAQWDIIRGITASNMAANAPVDAIHTVPNPEGGTMKMPAPMLTGNPVEALSKCVSLPAKSILFFMNAHMYVEKQYGDAFKPVIQAIWNLRDQFKKDGRTLILLCPNIQVPEELANDILVIDEPLPTEKELSKVTGEVFSGSGLKKPSPKHLANIVYAISGLATFSARQTVAMSIDKKTRGRINIDQLWSRKIHIIEKSSGLRVHEKGPCFENIGGNDNVKTFLKRIAAGARKPSLVVFIDEIEKAMAAAGTDTSGVTTDQLKVLLTEMQNNDWTGIILYGFPGTGKSELSKAFGTEAGCITAEADLGAMKNKWVGSSEARMRAFIKTIKAMGGRHVFFMATCNQIEILRPELNRRFRKGIFFCDLPGKKEREVIWKIYFKKFSIAHNDPIPEDEGWTGAEIKACCENASELNIPLKEASRFLTIASKAMGDKVNQMRQAASGKYINAQTPGVYTYKPGVFQGLMKGMTT